MVGSPHLTAWVARELEETLDGPPQLHIPFVAVLLLSWVGQSKA